MINKDSYKFIEMMNDLRRRLENGICPISKYTPSDDGKANDHLVYADVDEIYGRYMKCNAVMTPPVLRHTVSMISGEDETSLCFGRRFGLDFDDQCIVRYNTEKDMIEVSMYVLGRLNVKGIVTPMSWEIVEYHDLGQEK